MTERRVPSGAGFAFEMGLRALDEQLRRIEALDSKAGILMATDGVLAGLLLSRGSLLLRAPRPLAAIAVLAIVGSLLLALFAFVTRRYQYAPSVASAIRLMAIPEERLRWRFLGNLELAVSENNRKLRWKPRFLTAALVALIAGVLTLGGYFVYAVIAGSI